MRLADTFPMLTAVGVLSFAGLTAQAATIQIDFGDDGSPGTAANTNTITSTTQDISDLIDSTGATTGVSLDQPDDEFISLSSRGPQNPGAPASNVFPGAVTTDGIYGLGDLTNSSRDTNNNGTTDLTFGNLDANAIYDFTIFASRPNTGAGDSRAGIYTATGSNSDSGTLEAANNTSNILTLSGVSPDGNGEILFSIFGTQANNDGSNRIYLNGLNVSSNPIPEPGSLALLGLGGLALLSRRRSARARR